MAAVVAVETDAAVVAVRAANLRGTVGAATLHCPEPRSHSVIRRALFLLVLAFPTWAFAAPAEKISELLRPADTIEAVQVHPSIWRASGNSNAFIVATDDGLVVIDTGLGPQAAATHAALRAVSDAPVRKLILTHAHADHIGGVGLWQTDGVETLAARAFALRNQYYADLRPFQARRSRVLWADVMPEGAEEQFPYPRVTVDRYIDVDTMMEVGGVTFHLLVTPGGEGPDSLSVWIPDWKVLFSGDTLGPSTATFPNLFTLRGENMREAVPMILTLERMAELEPEMLLTGHFDPLVGADEIAPMLRRTAAAVRYVHDATVAGMNEGKSLWTLMREIELPDELAVSEQYGRVAWGVRAIYESYTGWFRYESTTELYDVPHFEVYPELVALAGGPDAVGQAAMTKILAGKPLEALHLAEAALTVDPKHRGGLTAAMLALRSLAAEDGGTNFQVAGWLRARIRAADAALAELDTDDSAAD